MDISRIANIQSPARTQSSPGSIRPTPEWLSKHRIRALIDGAQRPGAMEIVTRIMRLVDPDRDESSGDCITTRELTAAQRWERDFDIGEGPSLVGTLTMAHLPGGVRHHELGPTDRQLAARDRLRAVRAEVGEELHLLLELTVARGRSFAEVARRFGVHHHTAKVWVCDAIRFLASYYDRLDRVRSGSGPIRAAYAANE